MSAQGIGGHDSSACEVSPDLPVVEGMSVAQVLIECGPDNTCEAPLVCDTKKNTCLKPHKVTFSVDMSHTYYGLSAYDDNVYLNGNFNGWCGECTPMYDPDGNGTYETTIDLIDGDYEYKFTVNGWDVHESWNADGTPNCTGNTDDGQFELRALKVDGSDMILDTVGWNSCELCGPNYTCDAPFVCDRETTMCIPRRQVSNI